MSVLRYGFCDEGVRVECWSKVVRVGYQSGKLIVTLVSDWSSFTSLEAKASDMAKRDHTIFSLLVSSRILIVTLRGALGFCSTA